MRKLALLAAVAAIGLAAPAAAQTSGRRAAPPASPAQQLSPEHRAAVQQSVARGRALFAIDRAAATTTRDMLVRLPDPTAAGVIGWVAQPQGNAVQVTYYAREGDNYVAVYRGQMLGGRTVSPQVFPAGSRPPLDAVAARMAAAREAVAAKGNRPCGSGAFNTIVLPPSAAAADPLLVYQISPRTARDRVPLGGHFLTQVAADGSAGETLALTGECTNLALPAVPPGQRPRPLTVTAPNLDMPRDIHVFLSLWTERPLAVAAGTAPVRLWGVTGQGIGELRQ